MKLYILETTDGDSKARTFIALTEDGLVDHITEMDIEDYDGEKVWVVTLGKAKKLVGERWNIE